MSFTFRFLTTEKQPSITIVSPTCQCGAVGGELFVLVKDIAAPTVPLLMCTFTSVETTSECSTSSRSYPAEFGLRGRTDDTP